MIGLTTSFFIETSNERCAHCTKIASSWL